ncbi:MAG TPA: hypothetical protein PKM69_00975 [Bacteroidales bacterium]|nr:hypothetical protein [Bacteroidales bacterium]
MKTLKYIFILVFCLGAFNSCLVDDTLRSDANDDGFNLAGFEATSTTYTAVANGKEYNFKIKMKLSGPTVNDIKEPITVTIAADPASTAVEGKHYRLDATTITLTPENNYLGLIGITMLTQGNEPPLAITPVLVLDVISATGDSKVVNNGKALSITLNYVFFCPFAGNYDVTCLYFHPGTVGYPTVAYGGVRHYEKELVATSPTKAYTYFGVWEDNYVFVSIDASNKVTVTFDRSDAKVGDPHDPSKVCSYDPITGIIQLYYYYDGSAGADPNNPTSRIFYETFVPQF